MAREELIAARLPTMRADLALAETCAGTGERVACPITVFGGAEDAIAVHSLKAWRGFTGAAFRLRLLAGGHFYLTKAGKTVADEIARDLAESAGLAGAQMAEAG
jgi:medium-chain acyl-[acyl-carrier-protein] hydrolase